ncbi:hypothetical protein [Sulfobacillus thermotolerans]|uniref:hypothetical protein n=1 Tax=Sulfobacillus thermotolerans TaxID=338644 RepID=UPI0033680976
MIRQSFHQELMQLEQELIRMGALVEDQLRRAVRSLTERNLVLARQVIATDRSPLSVHKIGKTLFISRPNRCSSRLFSLQYSRASLYHNTWEGIP